MLKHFILRSPHNKHSITYFVVRTSQNHAIKMAWECLPPVRLNLSMKTAFIKGQECIYACSYTFIPAGSPDPLIYLKWVCLNRKVFCFPKSHIFQKLFCKISLLSTLTRWRHLPCSCSSYQHAILLPRQHHCIRLQITTVTFILRLCFYVNFRLS
jgi:hypothetical protein